MRINGLYNVFQGETHTLAPSSLQLLQQLQATTSAATPVAAGAGANALSSVQHQLLLQQHLGLGAATPAHAAPPAVPSPPEINPANLQGLATLASLGNSAGEYGQCPSFSFYFRFFDTDINGISLFFLLPPPFSITPYIYIYFGFIVISNITRVRKRSIRGYLS